MKDQNTNVSSIIEFDTMLATHLANIVSSSSDDIDVEIIEALRELCRYFDSDRSALWQGSEDTPDLMTLTHLCTLDEIPHVPEAATTNEFFPWITQQLLKGQMVAIPDVNKLPAEAKVDRDSLLYYGDKSTLAIPITKRNRAIHCALSFAGTSRLLHWSDDHINRGRLAAQTLINVIELKQTEANLQANNKRLRRTVNGTVMALSAVMESRDPYTAGHQRRVAEVASAIATEMGLPQEQIEEIRVAGYLHDIGKISVPAELLSKPGRLKPLEMLLIQAHCQTGYDILKNCEFDSLIAEIAFQHHERFDGSGYPNHLVGKDISPGALIIAVADVVEAMSSHRPYRAAQSIDKVLDEITSGRGIRYAPTVVDACLRLFRERGYVLVAR